MNKKLDNTPLKDGILMCTQRAGVIINNFSIVSCIIMVIAFIAIIITPMLMIINFFVAILIVVFTLGLILLQYPFAELIIFNPEEIGLLGEIIWRLLPYLVGITLGGAVISLVLLLVDRNNVSVPRVAWSCFVIFMTLLGIVGLILFAMYAA